MSEELIYNFTKEDIKEVIDFCKNYHLEETKRNSGRTGSGPRSFGGEIDAFGPGKLNEIGISKIISKISHKKCLIDNEIYSNYQVGQNVKPDIIKIEENNIGRDPNLYIEIKPLSPLVIETLTEIFNNSTLYFVPELLHKKIFVFLKICLKK